MATNNYYTELLKKKFNSDEEWLSFYYRFLNRFNCLQYFPNCESANDFISRYIERVRSCDSLPIDVYNDMLIEIRRNRERSFLSCSLIDSINGVIIETEHSDVLTFQPGIHANY